MANFLDDIAIPEANTLIPDCNAYKRKVARAIAVVDQLQLAGTSLIAKHGVAAIQGAMGSDYNELARIHNATGAVIATLTPTEEGA